MQVKIDKFAEKPLLERLSTTRAIYEGLYFISLLRLLYRLTKKADQKFYDAVTKVQKYLYEEEKFNDAYQEDKEESTT